MTENGDLYDPHYDVFDVMAAGDIAALDALAKANPPFPDGMDERMVRHWITHAVHSRQYTVFDWVLSHGVPVNFCDDEGYSPLKSLLESEEYIPGLPDLGAEGVIRWIDRLLEAGAQVNFLHTLDETPLHRAALISSPGVVQHLLVRGADPFAYDAEYVPRQPIHYAQYSKWKDEVTAVLKTAMSRR